MLAVAAIAAAAANARSVTDCFINAPKSVVTTLDSITRVEMLLYYEAGSGTPSRNTLGGPARVKHVSDNMITFSTSPASEVTIARLPAAKGDSVLLVLTTVALPALDTKAEMYAADWTPLPDRMQVPPVNDLDLWLTAEGRERRKEVENVVPFVTAYDVFAPATGLLIVSPSIVKLIGKDNFDPIADCLRRVISYEWNGKKWSLVKSR